MPVGGVAALVRSNAIPDATHLWWAIRPSHKYPTLELRATDCTRLDDAVAIAALYRCLVRCLCRQPDLNADVDQVDRGIAVENKWLAQRYGVEAFFASRDGAVPIADMLEDMLRKIAAGEEALACWDDVRHCREIVRGGSSADAQLRRFAEAGGANAAGSLDAVQQLIARTKFEPSRAQG